MSKIRSITTLALVLGLAVATPLQGQDEDAAIQMALDDEATLVDRIVAVVGDSVITELEIQQELLFARQQGQTMTPRELLDLMVDQQLVLQAAAQDSTMVVPEEELIQLVDEQVQSVRQQLGSEEAYTTALGQAGLTPATYRATLQSRIRAQRIQSMYMQRALAEAAPVAVTETEMREFFEESRGQLGERPEQVSIQQVFVKVEPTDSAWEAAYQKADSLRLEIEAGADFAEVAAANSDDPGSGANGGDLGWFRRGQMVREMDAVAFSIRPGAVSLPFRSDFGQHVVLVERSRPGEVKARHILVRPPVGSDERVVARDIAQMVADSARAGANMDDLYAEYGDQDQPALVPFAREQIPQVPIPGYADALAPGYAEGDVIGPFQSQIRNDEYFVVLRIDDIRAGGEIEFADVRDQVQRVLLSRKQERRIIDRLRNRTYVEIRM